MNSYSPKSTSKVVLIILGVLLFIAGGIISKLIFRSSVPTTTLQASENEGANSVVLEHVKVKKVSRQTVYRTLTLPGDILPYEQASLYAMVAGYLEEIRYDKGDYVKKGDLIAKIAVPELEAELQRNAAELKQYKAALERDQANLNLKKLIYTRLANIQDKNPDMVSVEQVDEARGGYEVAQAELELTKAMIDVAQANYQKTKTLLAYSEIRAPYDGIITARWVDPGALIQVATTSQKEVLPIVHIMNIETVRIQFYVPETDVPFIKEGNRISLNLRNPSGKPFEGQITRFARALKGETRSMLAEVEIPNKEHQLKAGMYTIVTVTLEEHHNTITVPAEVVITEKEKYYVYTVENDIVKKLPVRTGINDGIQVEILEGLTGEEMVIVAGKGLISEGDKVKSSM
ncbi:MAG: efflux RND transporter periplasmic adaptor subunit [Planctomycetes bacterium]|nr:efflux RND transporter periplasmic adaptor subunit [Planctomycetota bacterium]